MSVHLVRAADQDSIETTDFGLQPDDGTVCSGAPDQAKGTTSVDSLQLPAERPVFADDRMNAVLAMINYPWRDLDYSIVFKGSRVGYRAMTLTGKRRIEVYVRPGESPLNQAFDLAHELGHAFDLKYNDEERRRKWRQMRGIPQSTPWFGCDACPDYGTPAGDFAETFAYLLLGPGNFHSVMAPVPRPEQLEELAAFCRIEHLSANLIRTPAKTGSPSIKSARAVRKTRSESSAEQIAKKVDMSPVQVEPAEQKPPRLEVPEQDSQAELAPLVLTDRIPVLNRN